jgi:TPR repeat protein
MYMRGKGVDKDEAEGVRWLRMAAEKGNQDGEYGLGMAYLKGKGIQKSDSLAYVWLKKAADLGHAEAQKEVAKRKP